MPLTPTPGDDALAAGFTLVPGTGLAADLEEYINRLADEVARKLQSVWSVPKGGTGATTPAAARTSLGTPWDASGSQLKFTSPQFDRIALEAPGVAFAHTLAYLTDIPAAQGPPDLSSRVAKAGDTMSGDLFVPNASAANSGFTVAYINGDGRLSRGSSSEKYKKHISEMDPTSMGEIFPGLYRYQMRSRGLGTDNAWHYGWIAERLAENPATAPFVVYVDGQIESIDFLGLLIAQTANLHARALAIEIRLTALETTTS